MRESFYNIIESKRTGLVGMILMLAVLLPVSASAKQLAKGKQLFADTFGDWIKLPPKLDCNSSDK